MVCLLIGAEAAWSYGIYNNSTYPLHVVGEVCPACFLENLAPGQDGFCPGNDWGCRGNTKISFWPINDEWECWQAPVKVTAHGWVTIANGSQAGQFQVAVYNDNGDQLFSGSVGQTPNCVL